MPLTLGLTGMDPATETALKAAFADANSRLGGHWQMMSEQMADHVVVDMDSMYGPMSWLRLHAAGKSVIGLTTAARTQTDFRLGRPFNVDAVAALLQQIAAGPQAEAVALANPSPAGLSPAPQPQDQLPEELPQPLDEEELAPPEPTAAVVAPEPVVATPPREPPSAAAGRIVPPLPSIEPAAPTPPPAAAPTPPAPAPTPPPAPAVTTRTLDEWLSPGRLNGRVRILAQGGKLLIDTDQRIYHGPAALKPLAGLASAPLTSADFETVDPARWGTEIAGLGEAQPLSRLIWFGALLAGQGQLATGYDPLGRYQLLKWPQTEREYPKHFRIATVMMKGPATLAEITDASGVSAAEVNDFVNANLATGFAEPYREPDPVEPAKPGGLFGRLRGR